MSKGKFLVASRYLKDPNFSETVVILIEYNRNRATGLVINRPTNVGLSKVLPELTGLKKRKDAVFIGGPVALNQLILLILSDKQPEESLHVFKNVYVSSNLKVLQQMINDKDGGEKFRVYAGYAGWAPGQLDLEVFRGDWHILQADVESIFFKTPLDIWPELINRSSAQWTKIEEQGRNNS